MSGQPHFEVYRDKRREWRWRFWAANGKIIAVSSESYKDEEDVWVSLRLLESKAAMYVEIIDG